MVDVPWSKATEAGALTGEEVALISQLSTTVTISGTTISALASDNSFNDSGSGFVAAGFAVDDFVYVEGFTGNVANNIFSGKITALTTAKMTIGGTDGDVIVDDAAGETVTITKWVSRRIPVSELASLGWRLAGTGSGHAAAGVYDFATDGAVASLDFTGLAGATQILVINHSTTLSVSGVLSLQLSVNNGSSFYSASGDYIGVPSTGAASNTTVAAVAADTNATVARSGAMLVHGANVTGSPKVCDGLNGASARCKIFVASTDDVDAVRVIPTNGGNINGGKIYCLVR